MLPIIQKEVVENKNWASSEEVMDYYAVGQCMPGVIAVNTSIFIGNKIKGTWGGIIAALGVTFPSFVVIVIIASFITNFSDLEVVQQAFAGIRVAVSALIINTIIKLWKSGIKDLFGIIIFLVVFVLSVVFDLSPIFIVIAAIFIGILSKSIMAGRAEK